MRKIIALVIFVLIFPALFLFAGPAEDFAKANEKFKADKFDAALDMFHKIEDSGYESAELFYNMGNAYFRLKKVPEAILYYERALRLDPGNEDIEFNLNVANLRTVDKIEPVPRFFLDEWLESIRVSFGSGAWAAIMTIFIWAGFASLAGFLLFWLPTTKKALFAVMAISFIIAGVSLWFSISQHTDETTRDKAIIFAPNVYVKSSPDEKGTDLFILHEGTKVRLTDAVGDWNEIRLANGNVGWLPGSAVVRI